MTIYICVCACACACVCMYNYIYELNKTYPGCIGSKVYKITLQTQLSAKHLIATHPTSNRHVFIPTEERNRAYSTYKK